MALVLNARIAAKFSYLFVIETEFLLLTKAHPALHPARPLPQPGADMHRRFLIGRGRECHAAMTEPRQANAEIRILGNVPGIPAADLAQHIGTKMVR